MKGAPTTPSEKAKLQVRRKGVRRQNWSRLPGTSFFSYFFFFFFFLLFWPSDMEKYCQGRAALWRREEAKSSKSLTSGKKKMEPRAPKT